MKKSALQIALENIGLEPRSYSGRGMYGKKCLGVVVSSENRHEITEAIIDATVTFAEAGEYGEIDELKRALRRESQDNMAYDTIVYWPGVEFTENESDDEG